MGRIREIFCGSCDAASVYGVNFSGSGPGGSAGPGDAAAVGTGNSVDAQGNNVASMGAGGFDPIQGGWSTQFTNQPQEPAPPSAFDTSMGNLTSGLNQINPQYLNSANQINQQSRQVGRTANFLQGIGMGTQTDPRFQAMAQSRLGQLQAQQGQQQSQQDQFFGRRGLEGSAAQLNQQNKLATSFGGQQNQMMANIGMQQMGRQDQALSQSLQARGQVAGMQGQRLAGLQGYLQNLAAPVALQTAQTAAEQAGESSGGGGGGKK